MANISDRPTANLIIAISHNPSQELVSRPTKEPKRINPDSGFAEEECKLLRRHELGQKLDDGLPAAPPAWVHAWVELKLDEEGWTNDIREQETLRRR